MIVKHRCIQMLLSATGLTLTMPCHEQECYIVNICKQQECHAELLNLVSLITPSQLRMET